MATYDIPACLRSRVEDNVKRIIRKCDKNGIPYVFEVSEPFVKTFKRGTKAYHIDYVHVTVDCTFSISGWNVLGVISRKDGIFQVYFRDPSLIPLYKDSNFYCDHCHSKRNRNSVVILENEKGDRMKVGSTCVKEFTCGLDGSLVVAYASMVNLLDDFHKEYEDPEESFCSQYASPYYFVHEIVAGAARSIREFGFTPASDLMSSTKSDILRCIEDNLVEQQDKDLAGKAIEWCKNLSDGEAETSSYLFNLRELCNTGICTCRHFGMLASLIPAYSKAVNKGKKKESSYVGEVGDKLELAVRVKAKTSYESVYGFVYILIMVDENNNTFVWKTSKITGVQVDDTIIINGTIKEHSEYHGKKQTVLTRCKVRSVVNPKDDADQKEQGK